MKTPRHRERTIACNKTLGLHPSTLKSLNLKKTFLDQTSRAEEAIQERGEKMQKMKKSVGVRLEIL